MIFDISHLIAMARTFPFKTLERRWQDSSGQSTGFAFFFLSPDLSPSPSSCFLVSVVDCSFHALYFGDENSCLLFIVVLG